MQVNADNALAECVNNYNMQKRLSIEIILQIKMKSSLIVGNEKVNGRGLAGGSTQSTSAKNICKVSLSQETRFTPLNSFKILYDFM